MDKRRISASFRKQASDGNFGSEVAEVYLEWFNDDDDDSEEDDTIAQELLRRAREFVHAELAASPNQRVRATVAKREQDKVLLNVPADDDELPL